MEAVRAELIDRYGPLPEPVANLLAVARFRRLARRYGVTEVSLQGSDVRFSPLPLRESQQLRMHRLHPQVGVEGHRQHDLGAATRAAPAAGSGPRQPVRDVPLLEWARSVLTDVLGAPRRRRVRPRVGRPRAASE